MNDEIVRAISARIRYAAILLRRNDVAGALAVLEQCERVLPLPSRLNMEAAKDAVKQAYKSK